MTYDYKILIKYNLSIMNVYVTKIKLLCIKKWTDYIIKKI